MILEAGLASTTHVFIKLVSICRWPLWPKENPKMSERKEELFSSCKFTGLSKQKLTSVSH